MPIIFNLGLTKKETSRASKLNVFSELLISYGANVAEITKKASLFLSTGLINRFTFVAIVLNMVKWM